MGCEDIEGRKFFACKIEGSGFYSSLDCVYTCLLKVANPVEKGKNEVEKKELFDEGVNNMNMNMNNSTALSKLFPGMNREREMSAMVSALTHVVSGEVPTVDSALLLHQLRSGGGHHHLNNVVTPNMPSTTTPSLPYSSTSYVVGTSSLKRSREHDTYTTSSVSHAASSPAMPTSKYHIEIFTIYTTFFNFLPS